MAIPILAPAKRDRLRRILDAGESGPALQQSLRRPREDWSIGYVVRTGGGIAPGESAECHLYEFDGDELTAVLDADDEPRVVEVWNVGSEFVAGGTYVVAVQELSTGRLIAAGRGGDAGLPDGDGTGCGCTSGISRRYMEIYHAAFSGTTGGAARRYRVSFTEVVSYPALGGPEHDFAWDEDLGYWVSEEVDVTDEELNEATYRRTLKADYEEFSIAGTILKIPTGIIELELVSELPELEEGEPLPAIYQLGQVWYCEHWNPLRRAQFTPVGAECYQDGACRVCVKPLPPWDGYEIDGGDWNEGGCEAPVGHSTDGLCERYPVTVVYRALWEFVPFPEQEVSNPTLPRLEWVNGDTTGALEHIHWPCFELFGLTATGAQFAKWMQGGTEISSSNQLWQLMQDWEVDPVDGVHPLVVTLTISVNMSNELRQLSARYLVDLTCEDIENPDGWTATLDSAEWVRYGTLGGAEDEIANGPTWWLPWQPPDTIRGFSGPLYAPPSDPTDADGDGEIELWPCAYDAYDDGADPYEGGGAAAGGGVCSGTVYVFWGYNEGDLGWWPVVDVGTGCMGGECGPGNECDWVCPAGNGAYIGDGRWTYCYCGPIGHGGIGGCPPV